MLPSPGFALRLAAIGPGPRSQEWGRQKSVPALGPDWGPG